MRTRIYAAGLILLCLLTLSGCGNVRHSPEAAWAVCADKVDMIIACQERNSEQTTIPAPRPQ
ncbi:TPA: Rz1-like lysis system protein LysC [Klebsiella pneumoniae]